MASYEMLAPRDPDSKTGRVWHLAEEITLQKGRLAKRGEVMDAYVTEGGNAATASTQYSQWKNAYLNRSAAEGGGAVCQAASPGPVQLIVGPDGRVVIPADLRAAMQITENGRVVARLIDGELRLTSLGLAVKRAQETVRRIVPPGVSLADELIAERRVETRREAEG